MGIRERLVSGEEIIAQQKPFYATSYRIIRYEETPAGENMKEIPYSRLSSIELVKKPLHKIMIVGTLMAIGGFFLLVTWGLITSVLAIAVGIGAVIYGGMGKADHYQLYAHGISKEEEPQWRMDYWGSGSFIATVRSIVGERTEFK